MSAIAIGDVVRFKSGGPPMTISVLLGGGFNCDKLPYSSAWCDWFDAKGKHRSKGFKLELLEKVE